MRIRNIFLTIILLFLTIVYLSLRIESPNFLFFSLGAVVIALCVLIFLNQSQWGLMKKHWLKPSYIFVFSYLIVSFQRLLDYWIGYKSGFRFEMAINHCIILELIGLVSFTLGYSWKQYSYSGGVDVPSNRIVVSKPSSFLIFLHFFIFVLYLSSIDINMTLSGEAYSLGYTNKTAAYSELLFFSVNMSIIYRRIIGRRESISLWQYLKSLNPIFLSIFTIYILLKFVSGDRGPVIYNLLLIIFGFVFVSERKLKLVWVLTVFIIAATVISVLGIARQTKIGEASFAERYSESSTSFSEYGRYGEEAEPTLFPATEELAGSFNVTLAGVNAIVNDKIEFSNGTYLIFGILNAIPFFSSLSAPYVTSLKVSSTAFANSYLGITGYSVGTTLISDLYLDMGLIWVMIGLFLIGMFFKRIDFVICSGVASVSKILVIICLCFSCYAISIPRNTFFYPLRYIVWACVILFLDRSFKRNQRFKIDK